MKKFLFGGLMLYAGSAAYGQGLPASDCMACERITLFVRSKELVADSIWKGLNNHSYIRPLLYFTDQHTYIAFATPGSFTNYSKDTITCCNELPLIRINRLDALPFHMENKMSFSDTASLFYRQPMMLCSDVETMHRFVPDFTRTEDWLQLVMHEYFHSFQFAHSSAMSYLADSVRIAVDSLERAYLRKIWFREALEKENAALLRAIECRTEDSLHFYLRRFVQIREHRRSQYEKLQAPGITAAENFWETIEGTARYVEYYMAGYFSHLADTVTNRCDTLFRNFADYTRLPGFENDPAFRKRTEIMPAYYYVTGFNLCRLMDKMNIAYRHNLFDHLRKGLYAVLTEALLDRGNKN